MYDTITCKHPLPIPEERTGEWLQTKDLDKLLENYIIEKDGTLWVERATSIKDDDLFGAREEWRNEFVDFSGTIEFHGFLENKDFVTFESYFVLGHLKDLKLKSRDDSWKDWKVIE